MKVVLIDTSKGWVGIVLGEQLVLKVLNRKLRRKFGKTIHMRDLRLNEKISVLRMFNKIFSSRHVKLFSTQPKNTNWWLKLIKSIIKQRINTVYVDYEIEQELRNVHPVYLRSLNIYFNKEKVQCADILAYGDSHHKLVKNIWKDVEVKRGDS